MIHTVLDNEVNLVLTRVLNLVLEYSNQYQITSLLLFKPILYGLGTSVNTIWTHVFVCFFQHSNILLGTQCKHVQKCPSVTGECIVFDAMLKFELLTSFTCCILQYRFNYLIYTTCGVYCSNILHNSTLSCNWLVKDKNRGN